MRLEFKDSFHKYVVVLETSLQTLSLQNRMNVQVIIRRQQRFLRLRYTCGWELFFVVTTSEKQEKTFSFILLSKGPLQQFSLLNTWIVKFFEFLKHLWMKMSFCSSGERGNWECFTVVSFLKHFFPIFTIRSNVRLEKNCT